MESTILILLCCTIVYVQSQDYIPAVLEQIRSLDRELNQLKMDIPQLERKMVTTVKLSQLTLRTELKTRVVPGLIDKRVRDSLADIFKDRSLEDMVSEISHLKMNNNMLRRQQQHMSREISQLRKERFLGERRHVITVPVGISENLELTIDDLLDGLSDTKNKVKELRDDHSTLKTKHNELESSAENVWMWMETVENKTNLLKSDVKAFNQEIIKVQVATSNNSEEVQGMFERVNQENDRMENKINILNRDVTHLTNIMTKVRMNTSNNSDLIQGTVDRLKQQSDQVQILLKRDDETSKQFDLNEALLKRFQNDLKFLKEQHTSDYNGSSIPVPLSTTPTPGETVRYNPVPLSTTPTPGETVRYTPVPLSTTPTPGEAVRPNPVPLSTTPTPGETVRYTPVPLSTTPTPGETVRPNPVPLSTTPTPGETVRSRLLISEMWTSSTISRQLKLDGNHISTYPYLTTTGIDAITYDPTNNAIVYSRYSPAGIYTTSLNGKYTSTLSTNILSYGLAIDEGRQLLFLTTYRPSKTVSRMRTDGENFIAITDLSKYGVEPYGIALDTRNRMIYMSNWDKLFSLTYEGRSLQILYSGKYITSVTLDVGRGLLYFSDRGNIMRRPLSGGSSVRVGEVDNDIWNMEYYNNTVYISDRGGNIYALYTSFNNDVLKKLTALDEGSVISLIP